jgi:hypothetical protein
MTHKEALAELIAKVEAGVFPSYICAYDLGLDGVECIDQVYEPFAGSLDAAKALHEAVLPEWAAAINTNGVAQVIGPRPDWSRHTGTATNQPARAWLLAILRALHSTEPDT